MQSLVFIHSMIPDLSQEENSLPYDFDWTPAEKVEAPKEVQGTIPSTPLLLDGDGRNTRSWS